MRCFVDIDGFSDHLCLNFLSMNYFFIFRFILFFTDTGVGGVEGNGDIFNPDNQAAFIQFVKDNTDGKGVHFVMADGVRFNNKLIGKVYTLSWPMG